MYDFDDILPAILKRQAMLSAAGRSNGNVAMARWADECMEWTRGSLVR